jgi:hypothetical protein
MLAGELTDQSVAQQLFRRLHYMEYYFYLIWVVLLTEILFRYHKFDDFYSNLDDFRKDGISLVMIFVFSVIVWFELRESRRMASKLVSPTCKEATPQL